ncbi:rhodanese-related sulfurtransferase [Peribacillus deserti]|uniref:Rhodanese-related sulfurtransferase n=1 Tax=Peribacillus deserti TaxID=673318 RepID=A0ABS2QJJ5_9BACI|nr:rhodanese-like domain-containing protein [Peribacillus deserti]MBM7693335.1 rhodanese-related sulfurtransferase [Peribacillus deserti]
MIVIGTLLNIVLIAFIIWFLLQRILPVSGVKNMNMSELKKKLHQNDIQFIDVRTPAEFKANHIKGFKNIPLGELHKRSQELSKQKEVYVICQSGIRSSRASKLLKKIGFEHITNITGGMNAWH